MKKHPASPKMMAATLTATLLLTGTLLTAEARDRGEHKKHRSEKRIEQRDERRRSHSTCKRTRKRHGTHKTTVVTHIPKRHRYSRRLPRHYQTFHVDGHRYYYSSGRYYRRHHRHGYEIVHAPRIHRLPRHARRIIVNHVPYYVYGGVYYCHHNGYYEVCEAPIVESRVTLSAGPLSITFSDYDY